jgi:hypothetical protein
MRIHTHTQQLGELDAQAYELQSQAKAMEDMSLAMQVSGGDSPLVTRHPAHTYLKYECRQLSDQICASYTGSCSSS